MGFPFSDSPAYHDESPIAHLRIDQDQILAFCRLTICYVPPDRQACKLGCEGIMSKQLGTPYRSGRSKQWVKVKNPAAPAVRREAEEDWGRHTPTIRPPSRFVAQRSPPMIAAFNWVDGIGYLGALITLGTYSMKRMVPLRIVGMCANCVFISYGLLEPVYPQLILHSILLPLNAFRLREMLQLISQVKTASQGNLNMEWLKPYMARRSIKRGDVLFRKGDLSTAMFYTVEGRYRLNEIGKEIGPGQIIGEIGLIAPDKKRTLTFEAIEDGVLLTISYSQVKQLYYQNPEFGFYLLRLIGERFFEDIDRDMR
jgi:hypothetical protein